MIEVTYIAQISPLRQIAPVGPTGFSIYGLPRDLGLPDPRWTLTSFREFLVKRQRVLKRISPEHVRRVLKKR